MAAKKEPPNDRLFATRWVHVFEEDTADGAVIDPKTIKCRFRGGRGNA